MCIKVADNYPSTMKYVPDRYKTQVLELLIIILLH